VRIEASRPATTGENITQHIVRIPSADPGVKRLALRTLAAGEGVRNGIVFCNRKSEVDIVAKSLKKHGFDASPIHGDLEQSMRTRTLDAFRKGELKLLVASDVAARGLDIPDVSHVFNYDVPHHADDYVHRIGRTGRAGKSGETYMLVTPADTRSLDKVLKLIGKKPNEVTLDVDWSEVKPSTRAKTSRPERGGDREHDRGRGRPASETSVASMTPITPTVAETAESAPVQPARSPRVKAPKPDPIIAAERPAPSRRGVQPVQPREDDDDRVVGFGGDLPAFLARPPMRV
jgi:superfamily II DNA/RNA helicase